MRFTSGEACSGDTAGTQDISNLRQRLTVDLSGGTDKEINAAEYGAAPDGDDYLIIGHECFGRVEAVGASVSEFKPGDYVALTLRRAGS